MPLMRTVWPTGSWPAKRFCDDRRAEHHDAPVLLDVLGGEHRAGGDLVVARRGVGGRRADERRRLSSSSSPPTSVVPVALTTGATRLDVGRVEARPAARRRPAVVSVSPPPPPKRKPPGPPGPFWAWTMQHVGAERVDPRLDLRAWSRCRPRRGRSPPRRRSSCRGWSARSAACWRRCPATAMRSVSAGVTRPPRARRPLVGEHRARRRGARRAARARRRRSRG